MRDLIKFVYEEVWWYVFSMIKLEADTDDIIQDLCLMICLRKTFFSTLELNDQKAFVMRSAKNKVIDRYRDKKRLYTTNKEHKTEPNIYNSLHLKEVMNYLNEKESCKQLIDFAKGMTLAEIQNEYKISQTCAADRNYNARQRLKKVFK